MMAQGKPASAEDPVAGEEIQAAISAGNTGDLRGDPLDSGGPGLATTNQSIRVDWICRGYGDKIPAQLAGSCPVEELIRNLG
jgi:hypothetical protein